MPVMITLGDSIMWGQGLPRPTKFSSLVHAALEAELQERVRLRNYARSGAKLGSATTTANGAQEFDLGGIEGELPGAHPTCFEQLLQARADVGGQAREVRLVLVVAGANDVEIVNVLDPFANPADLAGRIADLREPMEALLRAIRCAFPEATVVVGGYFPILSGYSLFSPLNAWLGAVGIGVAPLVGLPPSIAFVAQQALLQGAEATSRVWVDESDRIFRAAIAAVNDPDAPAFAHFAPSNIRTTEATFSPIPRLWGLRPNPLPPSGIAAAQSQNPLQDFFLPQDPLAAPRQAACDPTDPGDFIECTYASVGHPNPLGARAYARSILGVLREAGVLRPLTTCESLEQGIVCDVLTQTEVCEVVTDWECTRYQQVCTAWEQAWECESWGLFSFLCLFGRWVTTGVCRIGAWVTTATCEVGRWVTSTVCELTVAVTGLSCTLTSRLAGLWCRLTEERRAAAREVPGVQRWLPESMGWALPLLLHPPALTGSQGRTLRLPAVPVEERKALEHRWSRLVFACGCGEGGIATLIATGVVLGLALRSPPSDLGTGLVGLAGGLAMVAASAVTGKLLGIAAARIRLAWEIARYTEGSQVASG